MDIFYHVTKTELHPGSILEPRFFQSKRHLPEFINRLLLTDASSVRSILLQEHWERLAYNRDGIFLTALIEAVFEDIRSKYYSNIPCRWDSSFLFPTLEHAVKFRETYHHNAAYVFSCEIKPTPNTVILQSDMALVNPGIDLFKIFDDELLRLQQRAHLYWQAAGPFKWPEILCFKGLCVVLDRQL